MLPGYVSSDPTAVNNLGTSVGYVTGTTFNSTIAVKWSPSGAVTDLGTLPGDDYSEALGINDLGQIVGYSGNDNAAVEHAVEWNAKGVITDLGAVPGEFSLSDAYGINDRGEVVGSDQTSPRGVGATRWQHGTIDDFGANQVEDIGESTATAVNDLGVIAGFDFVVHGAGDAVRWNADGSYLVLPDLPDAIGGGVPGNGGAAYAINNLDVVVGSSPSHDFRHAHAVRWDQQGNVTDLGTLSGGLDSAASGVNDLGAIVGTAADANGDDHAVAWSRTGTMSELPGLPGGSSADADAVSDTGFIVGEAFDAAGNDVAVLWH